MRKANKPSKKEWSLIILLILLSLAAIGFIVVPNYNAKIINEQQASYDEKLLSFNNNWVLNEGDNSETITLPKVVFAKANESVSISRLLPEAIMEGSCIRIKSESAYIAVYVDSQLIYSSGHVETVKGGELPLSRWNFIALSPSYSGKTIRIEYSSPYGYFSGILPEIVIGTHAEVLLYTFSCGNLSLYIAVCVIAIGLVMLLIALINAMGDNTLRAYSYLATFIILSGLALLSVSGMPRNFLTGYYKDYLLFHIALRIGLIALGVYSYARSEGKIKKLCHYAAFLCGLNLTVCMLLHFCGVSDFTETLGASVILLAIMLIGCMYIDCVRREAGSLRYRLVSTVGWAVLTFSVLIEACFKLSYKTSAHISFIGFGALFFCIAMSVAVILSSYDISSKQLAVAKELDDKRVKLMMSQIQPHFIYNTLNTIRSMSLIEPKKAYDMIYHFSNYLKYNIDSLGDNDIIEFADELKHIKEYTSIECERFHKLKVIYEIEADSFLIPPLSIQPFVENAIKHGVCEKEDGGTVVVKSVKKESCYMVIIKDDGVGFDPSTISDTQGGIGIKNAVYRLRELVEAHVQIKSEPGGGCTVSVIIPKVLSEGDMQ